ncbi:tetratricopeptide repeat protein [Antribacter gilvus]|uniref:tetratricopeptide repeat protein n=1 Tax=Antribacter gilvus TaxID=2304675 RepID=UPI000F77AD52|nr:tetratricopeptide repeat protein [Antribacter gilvus]
MPLTIRLLGQPAVEAGGDGVHVRGRKAWGLLAYLLSADAPVPRQRLVDLLFGDADDPMGALRWNLSHLRAVLGEGATIGGEPVTVTLSPSTTVDVRLVTRGSWVEAADVAGLGLPLLAGMSFDGSPGFQLWLDGERRFLEAASAGALQDAARARLARGDPESAVRAATRLVELNPMDENANVLFILALRAAGDETRAAKHARSCRELMLRELNVDVGRILRSALDTPSLGAASTLSRATVVARLESGEAAVNAGAPEAGLDILRRAAWEARSLGDPSLLARTLVTLGSALVHAARGTDEEGAAVLVEGAELALDAGERALACTAKRELGYIALLRGQYDRSLTRLHEARALATDLRQLAWVELFVGKASTDLGRHATARAHLDRALSAATEAADRRCAAFAHATIGRLLIQREEWDDAAPHLERSLDLIRDEGWIAFRPYPQTLLGEVKLATGDVDAAEEAFESAYALGHQLGDPCWEGHAQRGAGMVAVRRGDLGRGLELLGDAPRACLRLPDAYVWFSAYAEEARNTVAIDAGAPAAAAWVGELEAISSRHRMREFQARAALQRVRLGTPGAREIAAALVGQVDNPALAAQLQEA